MTAETHSHLDNFPYRGTDATVFLQAAPSRLLGWEKEISRKADVVVVIDRPVRGSITLLRKSRLGNSWHAWVHIQPKTDLHSCTDCLAKCMPHMEVALTMILHEKRCWFDGSISLRMWSNERPA